MTAPESPSAAPPAWRRVAVPIAKLAVAAIVVVAAGGAVRDAWRELSTEGLRVDPLLALASGVIFLVAQSPMAWYWRRTLQALRQPAPVLPAITAFYFSQAGKYVPGKAMVVVLRTERMLPWGGRGRTIAACVFLETLTHMAVGAVASAALLGGVVPIVGGGGAWLTGSALVVGLACLAPTTPPVARRLVAKLAPPGDGEDDDLRRGLTPRLMIEGWAASLTSWSGIGASVWLAAASVGAADADSLRLGPVWLLAAALPVVAGFLSLLPAGVLVREGLMLGVLSGPLGEANALATTVAVRLIWVAAECLACGIVFMWTRKRHTGAR